MGVQQTEASRARRELEATRGRILAGAARVFAATATWPPTVDEIAQASGVARRTFYRHFASAEAVLLSLYDAVSDEVLTRVRAAAATPGEVGEKLRAGLLSLFEYYTVSGRLLRVLHAEALRPGSPLAPRRAALFEALQSILAGEIRAAQGRRVDPMVLAGVILAVEGLGGAFAAESADGRFDHARAARVTLRILGATLAPEGASPPPMPLAGETPLPPAP